MLEVEKLVGTSGISNGAQISRAAKKMFGKKFKGIYPVQGTKGVPNLNEGEVAVLNENMHWWSIIKKNGKLYELDSYNMDHLKNIPDIKQPRTFIQGPKETNCGPRTLTAAFYALNK